MDNILNLTQCRVRLFITELPVGAWEIFIIIIIITAAQQHRQGNEQTLF